MAWLDLMQPLHGKPLVGPVIVFHTCIAILVFIIIVRQITFLTNTLQKPADPVGWASMDYDANKGSRDSLTNYMASKGLDPKTTPMNQFSIATANFGGIFTEHIGTLQPWIGSVSGDAARRQVEAGARALMLDIWPDPADPQKPIIASMLDTQEWSLQNLWMKWGLSKGVGRYSNWQQLTRNTAPVGEIIKPAIAAAFGSSPGPQNSDPFFLILKLHGGMTKEYLNHLGDIVRDAIGGRAMAPEWNKCVNQNAICTATVDQFLSRVFVIVIPDIQPGYNSLPKIHNHTDFIPAFLATRLGEVANAVERTSNSMSFEPSGRSAVATAAAAACAPAAQKGFCIIQPSIGGWTTDNSMLFRDQDTYGACVDSGAQFVAVNLFSPNKNDGALSSFFDDSLFGKYSFRKV